MAVSIKLLVLLLLDVVSPSDVKSTSDHNFITV